MLAFARAYAYILCKVGMQHRALLLGSNQAIAGSAMLMTMMAHAIYHTYHPTALASCQALASMRMVHKPAD